MRAYEEIEVPVRGGTLTALRWAGSRPDAPLVLAAHGITANALSWWAVAEQLGGAGTLVAPDLRGRARSTALPPPYGMRSHAADLIAVLDALGVGSAVLAGHSLGGFVACVAACEHPDRIGAVVLVDGGVGFPAPEGVDLDAAIHAVIGPAMQRLRMTFPTPEAYLDFWRPHPALRAHWSPQLEAYLLRDLVGEAPELRSSCVLDAVRTDGGEVLRDADVLAAVHRMGVPATLLWAERGLQDEAQGLYDETRLAHAALPPTVQAVPVEDVNHYSIVLGERGAKAVAEHLPG